MSTLSQFVPFGGGIKSIQTGAVSAAMTTSGGGGALASSIFTISSVNTAKAIPSFQGQGRTGPTGAALQDSFNVFAVLTSATNVQVAQYTLYSGNYLYGRWYVVESN
jgi:hypothetical protein